MLSLQLEHSSGYQIFEMKFFKKRTNKVLVKKAQLVLKISR